MAGGALFTLGGLIPLVYFVVAGSRHLKHSAPSTTPEPYKAGPRVPVLDAELG
jgi:hypothetical protein